MKRYSLYISILFFIGLTAKHAVAQSPTSRHSIGNESKNGSPQNRKSQFKSKKSRKLIWHDEFNYSGLPDSSKWGYEVGGHGWGNDELQYYTKADTANTMVGSGKLVITARQKEIGKNQYSSARLVSKIKKGWKYGRIEIGAKLPQGRGSWPAIWMLAEDCGNLGWPQCGEIDIMEHVGYNRDSVFGTVHTAAYNHTIGTQKGKGLYIDHPYTTFHKYAIDWTHDKIDFLLDDEVYFSFSNEKKTVNEWPFDAPFYLLMNIAVGGGWGGREGVDNGIFPATMEIDYVRIFQ
ncbi:MAG: glycoside hydrolase family 16 protein [Ferruginibacter sp.]